MKLGGTEMFLMNYYRKLDTERVQFDFVFQGDDNGLFDQEINERGGLIFHIPFKGKHPIKFSNGLASLIKNRQYKVVYGQMDAMNAWVLWIAKKNHVPVRISHSHSSNVQGGFVKRIFNQFVKRFIPFVATDFWCCGELAGRWLYGDKLFDSGKVITIHNAIDLEDYKFDIVSRTRIREKYNLSDSFVIGTVGRLSDVKNHSFLIDVYSEVQKMLKNSKLLLVGDGPLRKKLEEKVNQLGLSEFVIFTGNQSKPALFYNAMDVFILPSFFEGLSISMIEAQANGLKCICSNGVTEESHINNVLQLNLDEDIRKWRDSIISCKDYCRVDNSKELKAKGFDISVEAKKMTESIESLIKEREGE